MRSFSPAAIAPQFYQITPSLPGQTTKTRFREPAASPVRKAFLDFWELFLGGPFLNFVVSN